MTRQDKAEFLAAVRKLIRERDWYATLEVVDTESYDFPYDSHSEVRLSPRPRLFNVTIEIDHPNDDGVGTLRHGAQFITRQEHNDATANQPSTDSPEATPDG